MQFEATLGQLQALTQATLIGDENVVVTAIVHPAKAKLPTDLALIMDAGILSVVEANPPQNAIVPLDLDIPSIPNQLKVARPKVLLSQLLAYAAPKPYVNQSIHNTAVIDPSANIGENVNIGPYVVIGPNTVVGDNTTIMAHVTIGQNITIGEDCLFYPGVRLADNVKIGHRVILHHNASIGADGFSFVTAEESSMESVQRSKSKEITASNTDIIKVHSVGNVVIEDDVEIGANSCVDRGTLGDTTVGRNTKIDNLVQVGHNVTIGENCLIAGMVGIAGSVKLGNRVVMAGHAGAKDNIKIGDDSIILPYSAPTDDVAEKTVICGAPGLEMKQYLQRQMYFKKLGPTMKTVKDLEQRLSQLEQQLANTATEATPAL